MGTQPDDIHHRPLTGGGDSGDRRPVPDPTVLTTEALRRDIASLQARLEARLDGRDELVDRLLQANERLRTELKADSQREMTSSLAAAKELVLKSESNMKEQIVGLSKTVETGTAGLRRDIDSIRDRVSAIENQKVGALETRTDVRSQSRDDRALIFGLIGAAVGLIALILTLFRLAGVGG